MKSKKSDLKFYIDTNLLEQHYLSLTSETSDGKKILSVETAEKIMLLEIYKALCLADFDNEVGDRNENGKN